MWRGSYLSTRTSLATIKGRASHSLRSSDQYCRDLVRTYDYENFLAGLLIPRKAQGAFFAIRAFNVEMASIKDNTPRNNFQASRLRFQFWSDTLDQIYSTGSIIQTNVQPVALSLCHYIHTHDLRKRWFERSLEARYYSRSAPHSCVN